jgi:hypothetical protein
MASPFSAEARTSSTDQAYPGPAGFGSGGGT